MRPIVPVLLLALGACGSSNRGPAPAETSADPAPLGALCLRFYARQRECVDDYLSRQLDVRAEYDMPPGIAAEVERDGHEVVVGRMRPEFERDTAPEMTDAICRQIAEKTPADSVPRLLAEGQRCLAKPDCHTFAYCAIETERTYIRDGGQHEPPPDAPVPD